MDDVEAKVDICDVETEFDMHDGAKMRLLILKPNRTCVILKPNWTYVMMLLKSTCMMVPN